MAQHDDLPVFVEWLAFLDWLLPVTERFPKKIRFTFTERLNNLALDVVEDLIEARYTRQKAPLLQRANLRLEKMRVLLRIAQQQHYLDYRRYEYAMNAINSVGKMLGGWLRLQAG